MSKISRTEIVQEDEISSFELFKRIKIDEIFFRETFHDAETACMFLARSALIKNFMICTTCAQDRKMRLVSRIQRVDKFIWNCTKPCTASKSIRAGSIFEHSRLSFWKIIKIISKYVKQECFLDIAEDLAIDRKTASAYAYLCRDRIIAEVTNNSNMLGGLDELGIPKVVEIDESLFFRAKYNRGNHTTGQWYVGGVERCSNKVFLVPVANRNTATLLQVIRNNVLPDTVVITDEWRAYSSAIRQITGIEHRTVNHTLNFVNPLDPEINTQKIEGFWSLSKRDIRSRQGIRQEEHYEYLLQFILSRQFPREQRINHLLLLFRINT